MKRLLNKKAPNFFILTWLIVLPKEMEGFLRANRGDLSFIITQDSRDIQVLNMIQKTLGFGKVINKEKLPLVLLFKIKKGIILLHTF